MGTGQEPALYRLNFTSSYQSWNYIYLMTQHSVPCIIPTEMWLGFNIVRSHKAYRKTSKCQEAPLVKTHLQRCLPTSRSDTGDWMYERALLFQKMYFPLPPYLTGKTVFLCVADTTLFWFQHPVLSSWVHFVLLLNQVIYTVNRELHNGVVIAKSSKMDQGNH